MDTVNEKILEMFRSMLPPDDETSDDVLSVLIVRAENTILDIIGRDKLPERLYDAAAELALIMFNRLGTEGETRRSDGGIDMSFVDGLPAEIKERLKNYPRKVGALNAADKKQAKEN